jgi:hypothetical protein
MMIYNPDTVANFSASKIMEWKSNPEVGFTDDPKIDQNVEK